MSYEIRIAERVANTIRRLKPRIALEVVDGIDRAGRDTHKHVRLETGPGAGRPCYWFKVTIPPLVLNVACVFLYAQDEESLYVTAIGMVDANAIQLPPGSFI